MIHFKPTVKFAGLQPEALLALIVIDQQHPGGANGSTFVTSITDDAPGRLPNSLHKKGMAFDYRKLEATAMNNQWVSSSRFILGPDYDIVVEQDHIHCEFDPKK
jgi:hypothetical protein